MWGCQNASTGVEVSQLQTMHHTTRTCIGTETIVRISNAFYLPATCGSRVASTRSTADCE